MSIRQFILLLLIGFISAGLARGQQTDSLSVITGKVYDQADQPIPNATVALYAPNKDSMITGTATDTTGRFRLQARPGRYRLRVSYISLNTFSNTIRLYAGRKMDVGTIHLNRETKQMEEIVVRAQETTMITRFDKRVMNVGQDVISMGGSALQVLDQMPSITTNFDGSISLRGSQSLKILINGKSSSIVSNSGDGLRTIPAHMIKRIEVITNPSARYQAEGTAGVINIILKKNREKGFNGSVTGGTGYPANHEISTNLNFRRDKINWFVNGGVEYETDPESGWEFHRYNAADTSYMYRQRHHSDQKEYDADLRAGADWYLPSDQMLTGTVSLNLETQKQVSNVRYTDFYFNNPNHKDSTIMRRIRRTETETGNENDLEFSLNYENNLPGSENHKLTGMVQMDISEETGTSTFRERVTRGQAPTDRQRSQNTESFTRGVARLDYVYPHSKQLKFEAGFRASYRDIKNHNTISEFRNGNWVDITGSAENIGGNFVFRENVNAVYGIVGYQPADWSFQLGLRAEQTNVETSRMGVDKTTTQSYIDLFPTLHVSYEFNQKNSVQASYTRRLSRPDAWSLIPFTSFSDTRSRWIGNPELDPIFTDSYELGYQRYWSSGNALFSVYYRHEEGVIERITYQQNGITYTRPINLATSNNWGVEVSLEQDLFDQLELRGSMNLYRSNTSGVYERQNMEDLILESHGSRLSGRLRLQYQFLGGWNYQASMRYQGPHNTTQGREFADKEIDMGISRKFWDGKARVSLRVRDVLNSEGHHSITNEENLYMENYFRWSRRSFSLDFTYYFNRDFKPEERDRGRDYR